MTAPVLSTPAKAKPNPFLSVQVALYKAGISFTHCSPSFARQRECWAQFWGAIQPTDFLQPVRMPGAQFVNPTPTPPGIDHTSVLFVEDEEGCKKAHFKSFEELFAIPTDVVAYDTSVPSETVYNLRCEVKRLQGVVNGDTDLRDAFERGLL